MNEITPRQLIEALTQFKEECHSNMEGCDLYEFIYWERGMVLAIEMIGYINREAPGVLETYDLLMEAKEDCVSGLIGLIADRPKKKEK